jgi:hypothetical protein
MLPKGFGDEDVNAIEADFFTLKGKSKTRQFVSNKVLDLYLGISFPLRNEIEIHIEETEESELNNKIISVSYQIFFFLRDLTPSLQEEKIYHR